MHHQNAAGMLVKCVSGSSFSIKYIIVLKKIMPVANTCKVLQNTVESHSITSKTLFHVCCEGKCMRITLTIAIMPSCLALDFNVNANVLIPAE